MAEQASYRVLCGLCYYKEELMFSQGFSSLVFFLLVSQTNYYKEFNF